MRSAIGVIVHVRSGSTMASKVNPYNPNEPENSLRGPQVLDRYAFLRRNVGQAGNKRTDGYENRNLENCGGGKMVGAL